MSDALRLKKYWGQDHKKQRGKYIDEFKKVMQVPLNHIFDYHIFVVHSVKYLLDNQLDQDNGYRGGKKNHYRCKNKHTQIYDLL